MSAAVTIPCPLFNIAPRAPLLKLLDIAPGKGPLFEFERSRQCDTLIDLLLMISTILLHTMHQGTSSDGFGGIGIIGLGFCWCMIERRLVAITV